MFQSFPFIMRGCILTALIVALSSCTANEETAHTNTPKNTGYLGSIVRELEKEWPDNKTVNLVFHGHSVPAGYFKTPDVQTFNAYPHLVHQALKNLYPNAVINVINTSIGGENSISGSTRFAETVLIHQPDVVFIDYALNDRGIGVVDAKKAWEQMILAAKKKGIKVILVTPSPASEIDFKNSENDLALHAKQIRQLGIKHDVAVADCYAQFEKRIRAGEPVDSFLSNEVHPNKKGHQIMADAIMELFNSEQVTQK